MNPDQPQGYLMPRPKNPSGLDDLGSHKTLGGAVVKAASCAQNLALAMDRIRWDDDGTMASKPSASDPPELWVMWSLSEQVKSIDAHFKESDEEGEPIDHRTFSALKTTRFNCLSEIAKISKGVRGAISRASSDAMSAVAKAEQMRIARQKAGIRDARTITMDDLDDIPDDELEAALGGEDDEDE